MVSSKSFCGYGLIVLSFDLSVEYGWFSVCVNVNRVTCLNRLL